MRQNQGAGLHQRGTAASVHPEGRSGFPNGIYRINIYYSRDSSKQRKICTVLQRSKCVCEYGRRRECTDGAKGRAGGDDGAHRTPDILQAHHRG